MIFQTNIIRTVFNLNSLQHFLFFDFSTQLIAKSIVLGILLIKQINKI